jgi:hypothetical protein
MTRRSAKPTAPTPAGQFTDLIATHDWPPGFESRAWGRASGEHLRSKPVRGQANGFDRAALGLPGAKAHTARWANEFKTVEP